MAMKVSKPGRYLWGRSAAHTRELEQAVDAPLFQSCVHAGRVLTRRGFIAVDALRSGEDVWTGGEWAPVRIAPTANMHTKYRVELSNGQRVVCGARQTWALIQGRQIVACPTASLSSGDTLFPFVAPRVARDAPAHCPGAARLGVVAEAAGAAKQCDHIQAMMARPADHALAFVSGWINAQGGHVMAASEKAAALLQLLLLQAGVSACTVAGRELFIPAHHGELFMADRDAACFIPGARTVPLRVVGVEKLRARAAMYHLWFDSPPSAQSVLMGTALILVPNTKNGTESPFMDSQQSDMDG